MDEAPVSIDLALAAGAALLGGLAARLLRQSVLLGYLAAGVVIGPFTPGPVGDTETIERLADVGVVLLMFSIGVHFSVRDLLAARGIGLAGGLQVALALLVGLAAGIAIGWPWRQAAVAGAVAAVSGGTVLTKLLAERGEEDTAHGRLAVAWSVVQDLATIALVVLVGVLAEGPDRLPRALGEALVLAVAFVGGMLLVGVRVVPPLLAAVARLGSRELFILAVAGLSLGTALLAEEAGLSLALGAFVAGVVVSGSDLSYHALSEVLPIREIFAALFFVSVGMLIDPGLLVREAAIFLLLTPLVVAKGPLVIGLATLVLRAPPATAVLAGLGLAQSAEFSFVLARQGVAAGIVSGEAFSLLLAATVASIALAPLLYRAAPLLERVVARVPWREPAPLPPVELPPLRNHVVICGAGRVGSLVAGLLRQRRQGYVIVEADRRTAERLRAAAQPVIYGDAASPIALGQARLGAARTLVVAIPDPVVAREIVDEARR